MESKGARKDAVATQVRVNGFDQNVTAKELVKYLEDTVGLIRRYRLKTSWTPPDSYPDFEVTRFDTIQIADEYKKVEPHAFVHFATPEAATSAYELSLHDGLFFSNKLLKVSLGPESPFQKNQRRRTTTPFKLPDVCLEIGNLITLEEFLVGWRGPSSGVDFFVDPVDSMCRFCFTRKTAFSFKEQSTYAVINCEFKMEFLVGEINEIRQHREMSSIVILLQLASPPCLSLIRTTDFTASGAVGRCNTYRVSIPPLHGLKLKKAMDYLREQEVRELSPRQSLRIQDESNFVRPMLDTFSSIHQKGIGFDVMFLLKAAIHKNVFSQHQLSESFFGLLKSQPKAVNLAALKHICSYKHPVFDACKRLEPLQECQLKNPKLLKNQKELNNIVEIRRLMITPIKGIVFHLKWSYLTEFLRVTFMDEGLQMINANVLKDWSAWFFAEDKKIDVKKIRVWMGKFNCRNTAKLAFRMGQCLSSTYATVEVPQEEVYHDLPDIDRNGYCFSDGIGTVTPDLAREVAEKLKLELDVPSAYQIHYARYKGMSNHTMLEIRSWTRFKPGFLNRQIVTLLSALKVPDEVFWDMQEKMVFKLNRMLIDSDVAFDVLTSSCTEQGNIAAIMLSAPQLQGLREEARIFLPSGRWLMGCLDELGVLEQGQCFIQVSTPALENCFIKHGCRFSETKKNRKVIKGCVVVAKSSCLHPGDIRILEAVDAPVLHHLYDCLVFPQNGERPHPNGASGSDFDGELYFVTWEENLIPPSKRSWAFMQYGPAAEKKLPRYFTLKDMIDFFVKHVLNENLEAICNAHMVHADHSEHGALDENCILLAKLAAAAVDFPKTGSLYKVNNEEELVTSHVWSMPNYASRKQGELKDRLKHCYVALRKEFREIFETLDLDSKSLSNEKRNLLSPTKKSVDLREHDDGGTSALMLSFAWIAAWIAADVLARIKIRNQEGGDLDSAKPINSLSKYIADRI
ncbi:hypothetical protein EUGRSUZ_C02779 [Eucalyptus grandis]|uniref:RNA-dependent RNA polymerase n=2 Tax=Eucalyptus grandis TaxID=71139 RepID=A0A059CSP6_EUCGR|nr:hypothetical protein EUGRSUZ_C02779 [Eucalyptus grandis]